MSDVNDRELRKLIKSLSDPPRAIVGIIAGKSKQRGSGTKGGPTNAEIGAAHEYGAPARGLPARSWLRMPINEHLGRELARDLQGQRRSFAQAVKAGNLEQWLRRLGVMGERVVRLAFQTGGYGKWAKLKDKTMTRKTVKNILVESTQLREAVTSDIRK